MTIMDKVNSTTRTAFQVIFDKEPVNYVEGASLYSIIAQGRHNFSVLEVLYNQALDLDLKALIKNCIDDLVIPVIKHCESLLASSNAQVPQFHYNEHKLHESIDIPSDARLTDKEIAMMLGAMAKASQTALLTALHQSYQLEIGWVFRKYLDAGLDWNFRLLQLMLDRGWLPYMTKITH
jgi:hypothetical protein